jgi:carboxyl-terminal processing protease
VPETENNPEAHMHKFSTSDIKKWPLKKIVAILVAVLLVFSSGVAVGKGELHARSTDANGKNLSQIDYSSVNDVFKSLKENFDGNLNSTQLLNGLKEGLVSSTGDPYTTYFNPDNNIVIVSPLSGYPAEKAGLKPKDIIAAVNSQPTSGMSVDNVVKKIRGPENTKVTLTVVRGGGAPFDVAITRVKISVPSVTTSIDGNIGYIKISQFGNDTTDLVKSAVNDFKSKGIKGVVLDLRGDPGGYLQTAIDVSSMWLDQGKTVVSERRGGVTNRTDKATGNNPLKGMATAVLIDGGSASASEITAGALHDNNAATLVGVKSFGKGSVQQVINLGDGSELKVTIAHWYTPAGKNIDKQGITPDVVVQNSDADVKAGKDPQKDKAFELVRQKL